MGRNKTRKKNQRGGQTNEDQDPEVSEPEPSPSDNASTSLNETFVLNNSSNLMDTDAEDLEPTATTIGALSEVGEAEESSPSDQMENSSGFNDEMTRKPGDMDGTTSGVTDSLALSDSDSSTEEPAPHKGRSNNSRLANEQQEKQSVEPQQPSVTCPHVKSSTSMSGIRKALKSEVNAVCSMRPCVMDQKGVDPSGSGAGDAGVTSNGLWICLQCGNFGCGDLNAQNGDAERHFKIPRSDQHSLVLSVGEETDKSWCFTCNTSVDVKHPNLTEAIKFLKRHPKLRTSLQQQKNKTGTTPIIALGPPPPPPQPEMEIVKPSLNKNKMNGRNKITPYSSNWDNSSRDEWPMGLENLGNTCFMNSALQCLSRTRSLIPKLDLYGTGNVLEIRVTADPPSVRVMGTVTPDTNGDADMSIFHLGSSVRSMEENGDANHISTTTETETGGSSPSSSEMDSLLDVASGTSSKSSPSKELSPDNYKQEIEKELKRCLPLKLVISKDSMTSRLRLAFKTMTRSSDVQSGAASNSSTEYFGRGRHVFTPSAIHNAMAKHFRVGQQHDSHELLRTVIDMMKKDQVKAFRLAIMECYGIKKTEGKNCNPCVAELLKMWDRKLYHKTFVDEIFGGELVTFQTCLTCGSVRKSHEDFLDISLPIRVYSNKNPNPKRTYSIFDDDDSGGRSIQDCLKSFTEAEQLTGSNAVECENCHRLNLEKLEAGASFEEVFPGVKPPVSESRKLPEPTIETEIDALEPLLMEEESPQVYENSTEDMDDLDEPAVDGIIGNTSDMEDEGNDVPPLFLTDTEEKSIPADFLSSDIPKESTTLSSLAATQDEGFSESDSSEEKKSVSISASSSRNSISEAENGIVQKKENSEPIPITKCPCSRRQMVWRPPECLTVHLKRFQITSHGTSKLSDRVNFPYILNLTPFCAQRDDDVQSLEDGKDIYDEDGEVKYALYGIVEHSGSLHWGHYVAYVKVHGTNSVDDTGSKSTEGTPDKWFYISDSSVSPSSLESVLGMDPYILFYERIRGQDKKDKVEQLHKINNPSSSTAFESTSTSLNTDTQSLNYALD